MHKSVDGLKSSIGFVQELVTKNDINFTCEHWLQYHELDAVKSMQHALVLYHSQKESALFLQIHSSKSKKLLDTA